MSKVRRKTTKEDARKPPVVAGARSSSGRQVHELIHELQVYTEEVTVQNEQLLKAQHELELARDRFADLYDFAPIGYLLLDVHGTILDINLAGAALLGKHRSSLVKLPLTSLVSKQDRDRLRAFLAAVGSAESASHIELQLKVDGHHIVRLIARSRPDES